DAVAAGAAVRQLLVGLRVVAATGTGPGLGAGTTAWPRRRRLVASSGIAGGEPADRSRQRVPRASPMVRSKRDGCIAGGRLRGGGEGPAVPLSGPHPGAPAGVVPAFAAAVEDAVRRAVRCAAVRSDQYVWGRRSSAEPEGQAWLQP